MSEPSKESVKYPAKTTYLSEDYAKFYENRPCYTGLLGWFRKLRETTIVSEVIKLMEGESVVLDCPCGNGRWFQLLTLKAKKIIAMDISHAMLFAASRRARSCNIEVLFGNGDAEHLPLNSNSVDYVFSFALLKHLPTSLKFQALKEFSRVCRKGILCSLPIFTIGSFLREKTSGAYRYPPLWKKDFIQESANMKLRIISMQRLFPYVGAECVVFLKKDDSKNL